MLGVGLGLGFATFVREQLENAQRNHHDGLSNGSYRVGAGNTTEGRSIVGQKQHQSHPNSQILPTHAHHPSAASSTEDTSYIGLMASAGYAVPKGILRGQILRNVHSGDVAGDGRSAYQFVSDVSKRNSRYSFPTIGKSENSFKGKTTFQRMWPSLPREIHVELGLLVDYIIRDYITSWYAFVDDGLQFENEAEKRKRISREALSNELPNDEEEDNHEGNKGQRTDKASQSSIPPAATMVLSTKPSRTIPFIEILYTSLCTVLGNLAHAGDNINVAEIVLVKFLHILEVNIKVYREIRKCVLEKERKKKTVKSVANLFSETIIGAHRRQRNWMDASRSKSPAKGTNLGGQTIVSSDDGNGGNDDATGDVTGDATGDATDAAAGVVKPSSVNQEKECNERVGPNSSSTYSQSDGINGEDDESSTRPKLPRRKFKKLEPVSEIGMVREYLLQGKLHRAITFGMDVPGLLFGDMKGEECPLPTSHTDTDDFLSKDEAAKQDLADANGTIPKPTKTDEDEILEQRLFGNNQRILSECETDYNRLLAHRLCRIIFPRHDFNSPVGRSVSVEMVASCILTPIMGCFTPDYINSWILKCLDAKNDTKTPTDVNSNSAEVNGSSTYREVNEHLKDTTERTDPSVTASKDAALNSPDIVCADASSSNEDSSDGNGRVESFAGDDDEEDTDMEEGEEDETVDSLTDEANVASEVLDDESSDTEDDENDITHITSQRDLSCEILLLLAASLIELQSHIDFGDRRIVQDYDDGAEGVNWTGKDCCNAVRNLVLIIEAALTHGMLESQRKGKNLLNNRLEISVVNDAGGDNAVEMSTTSSREIGDATVEKFTSMKASSLISLLMEITSDLESFEKKVDEEETDGTYGSDENLENKHEDLASLPQPNSSDLSTLRTLIAAWLHTGLLYRTMSVLIRSKRMILRPFYHHDALLNSNNAAGFVKQLKVLHGVAILVDTATVLASPPLDLGQNQLTNGHDEQHNAQDKGSDIPGFFPTTTSDVINVKPNANLRTSSGSMLPGLESWQCNNRMDSSMGCGSQNRRGPDQRKSIGAGIKANFENNRKRFSRLVRAGSMDVDTHSSTVAKMYSHQDTGSVHSALGNITTSTSAGHQCTPSYLHFHKNEVFATSLRTERDRRMESFARVNAETMAANRASIEMICRSRAVTDKHIMDHKELHNLVKLFYSNTVALVLQNVKASRKEEKSDLKKRDNTETVKTPKEGVEIKKRDIRSIDAHKMATVLMMESMSLRRKMEVPDDDSSFLLRAQPRPLNVIGIHRDQHNHGQSYKKYAAYYDEPVIHPKFKTDRGARLRKKCCLRYYPSDRTASISFIYDNRKVDHRKCSKNVLLIDFSPTLPKELQKERYLCNKAISNGPERLGTSITNTLLANTVMDASDFSLMPRTGRAVDFVYRMSLYERPAVELAGKKIVVQDSAALGAHQADASSLEISDPALSAALLMCDDEAVTESRMNAGNFTIKCSSDGMPLVFMKLGDANKSHPVSQEKSTTGVRPYRISFVRAALMVNSSRREAQLQCLLSFAGSGSTRNVTKSRTDILLQPTLGLLDFATSTKREKQSILLRDLKLGINHIDREQLRRNGLLNPRFPTRLRQLKVTVEGAVHSNLSVDLLGTTVMYKIRCIAVTEFIGVSEDADENTTHDGSGPENGDLCVEDWVVMRSYRDFSILHKFLKTQVSPNESSGGPGAKIVGAATGLATAAFTIGTNSSTPQTKRKALIPSLSQASKVGPLGVTKKFVERRKQVLNDYLRHLLSSANLMNRCPELLRFLGAYEPFPPEVKLNCGILTGFTDSLGRSDMCKSVLQRSPSSSVRQNDAPQLSHSAYKSLNRTEAYGKVASIGRGPGRTFRRSKKQDRKSRRAPLSPAKLAILASIKSRIERVKLTQVRNTAFELIRFTFDLDNASFFRNQMISALKTVSYALTSGQDFNETLINFHFKYLSAKSLASYVKYTREIIWPGGVIFQRAPELTKLDKQKMKTDAKKVLHDSFPDQLKAVLGHESTENGVDFINEMLQNRVVLKSMAYMMMDALLLEMFPEVGDILSNEL